MTGYNAPSLMAAINTAALSNDTDVGANYGSPTASTSTLPSHTASPLISSYNIDNTTTPVTGKVKKQRRSKVAEACKFCRKSHMSCDAGRPCSRCVKRGIAHLCRDDLGIEMNGHAASSPGSPAMTILPPLPSAASPSYSPHAHSSSLVMSPSMVEESKSLGSNLLGLENHPHHHSTGNVEANAVAGSSGSRNVVSSVSKLASNSSRYYPSIDQSAGFDTSYHHMNAPMLESNFNMAMLDLASGQDGMGADLGIGDYSMDDVHKDSLGGEFQGLGLSEFLQSLHENSFADTHLSPPLTLHPLAVSSHLSQLGSASNPYPTLSRSSSHHDNPSHPSPALPTIAMTTDHERNVLGLLDGPTSHASISAALDPSRRGGANGDGKGSAHAGVSAPTSPLNKTERFLLTAADQKDGSRSDRLARVIHAKFEAGLLRPYNHVVGYTRLMRWMADNMSPTSRQRTLHTLSEFRPAFRAVASGLTDLDLVFIEEAFERLLLDYDRVFSSMGIPSCLWRRTGEIYKGNKEFAALVGVPIEQLRDGKLAIYELMAEESAVNYWEKYGNIAFDAGQKAVLTSCVLVNQAALSRKQRKKGGIVGTGDREKEKAKHREDAMINCCFSFTVRRDSYAIPSMIVGNFLQF